LKICWTIDWKIFDDDADPFDVFFCRFSFRDAMNVCVFVKNESEIGFSLSPSSRVCFQREFDSSEAHSPFRPQGRLLHTPTRLHDQFRDAKQEPCQQQVP